MSSEKLPVEATLEKHEKHKQNESLVINVTNEV